MPPIALSATPSKGSRGERVGFISLRQASSLSSFASLDLESTTGDED